MAKKTPFTAAFSSAMDDMNPAGTAPAKKGKPSKKGSKPMVKSGKKC